MGCWTLYGPDFIIRKKDFVTDNGISICLCKGIYKEIDKETEDIFTRNRELGISRSKFLEFFKLPPNTHLGNEDEDPLLYYMFDNSDKKLNSLLNTKDVNN